MAKDYGIKITRDGYDLATATDKQCVLTSKYKTLTVAASGTATVQLLTTYYRNSTTVAHNLGYVPAFVVFGQEDGESYYYNVPFTHAFADFSGYFLFCWADNTNLYLEAQYASTPAGTETYNFKYFIFNNPIEV